MPNIGIHCHQIRPICVTGAALCAETSLVSGSQVKCPSSLYINNRQPYGSLEPIELTGLNVTCGCAPRGRFQVARLKLRTVYVLYR